MDYDKKIWEAIDKEAEEILQELDEAMKKNPVLRTIEASKSLDERVRAMIPEREWILKQLVCFCLHSYVHINKSSPC